ncbi:DNA-directed DNA polymerase [Handroanthus impetiginosus]|uniref:DNA-directed DNA polymerase n=1 Tax=Handroanthus impetiginosus TaxID=429701 RepID=A0A2G9GC02_9LAMI|nr:DNA-directed DNA polymerase [Handroanthus impetiginosus]
MLRNYPNHDIPRHIQVHTFYHGLTDDGGKDKLNHLNGDYFLLRTTAECHNLLNNFVASHYEKKKHHSDQCPHSVEFIQFVSNARKPQNNPYSNTFNPGCKQHSNFSRNNNQGQGSSQRFQQGMQQQAQQSMQEKKSSLEETLMQFMASTAANFKTIETQIGQLKLHINIPFTKILEQMPSYVKFMKDILSKKRCLGDYEMVALTKECSAIIQNKLPHKLKDPGSFTIPCTIGTHFLGRALRDLGASINLIPYSIYRTLGLREAKPTDITLQLADKSLTYPKGVIEDILVKVDKFIFPADFVVLDMEADCDISIILGRHFLATWRTLIDVQKGELIMRVQDQQITFNIFKATKFSNESDECFSVNKLDNLVGKEAITERPLDPLEHALLDLADEKNEEDLEAVKILDASKFFKSRRVESLERTTPSKVLKYSIEEPPILELKSLPNHIRYAYLGESDTPLLKDHKSAIGWTIADIKGISPSFCMHKILLKDDQKPSVKSQRWLNPIVKEVVKKKIIKWLDAGIIYPISDSSQVSPIQCVPKKGEITMVPNMHSKLIPTRTATRKDRFPLSFIDQMLNRLVGKEFYCFLDGYSGYNQIAIAPKDQEKITFTCPYGTFAFRRMPFGLCNAPATFQRCIMAIFTEMVEIFFKVFIDNFSVYGNSFDKCLNNLSLVLKRYRKGTKNQIADHLSRLESFAKTDEPNMINNNFSYEQLLAIIASNMPWYANIVNYLTCKIIPFDLSTQQKKKFLFDTRRYFWDEPFLFKQCSDNILRHCVPEVEMNNILEQCHASPYGGHFQGDKTAAKIVQSGFYWPNLFKDAHSFVTNCDRCHRIENISRRHEMPLNTILEIELFDVWGIDFMASFVPFFCNLYIVVAVDYVSK